MNVEVVYNWQQADKALRDGADVCVLDEPGIMAGMKTRIFARTGEVGELVRKISGQFPILGKKRETESMIGFNVYFMSSQDVREALSRETAPALPAFIAEVA